MARDNFEQKGRAYMWDVPGFLTPMAQTGEVVAAWEEEDGEI